jgi:hypothetical protein
MAEGWQSRPVNPQILLREWWVSLATVWARLIVTLLVMVAVALAILLVVIVGIVVLLALALMVPALLREQAVGAVTASG